MTASLTGTGVQYPNGVTQYAPYLSNGNNLLANGDMRIQRAIADNVFTNITFTPPLETWATGSTAVNNSTLVLGGTTTSDLPPGQEYTRALQLTVGASAATLSNAATGYFYGGVRVGPNDMQHLNWGTATAKTVTLAFWVKCSVVGTYNVTINSGSYPGATNNTGYSYCATYTVNTANTWEQKIITIPGPTGGTGTWTTGTPALLGMQIIFPWNSGTTYTGAANTWSSTKIFNTAGSTSFMNTANASWKLAGLSLEVGTAQVTPYVLASQPSLPDKINIVNRYSMVMAGANASTNPTQARYWGQWNTLVNNFVCCNMTPVGGFAAIPNGYKSSTTNLTAYYAQGTSINMNASAWGWAGTTEYVVMTSTATVSTGQGGYFGSLANSGNYLWLYASLPA